jgi:hypothetical protein
MDGVQFLDNVDHFAVANVAHLDMFVNGDDEGL